MELNWTEQLLNLAFAALAPVLIGAVVMLVKKYLAKLGIQVDAGEQAKLEHFIGNLLTRVEEWARLKLKTTGIKPTSAEKRDYFLSLVAADKPELPASTALAVSESLLGRTRTPGDVTPDPQPPGQ